MRPYSKEEFEDAVYEAWDEVASRIDGEECDVSGYRVTISYPSNSGKSMGGATIIFNGEDLSAEIIEPYGAKEPYFMVDAIRDKLSEL